MSCSFTGTSGTLAEAEKLFCMAETGKGKLASLFLSKGSFQHHQESRATLIFEDLTQYPQLRAPGVTVERILPSILSSSPTSESSSWCDLFN